MINIGIEGFKWRIFESFIEFKHNIVTALSFSHHIKQITCYRKNYLSKYNFIALPWEHLVVSNMLWNCLNSLSKGHQLQLHQCRCFGATTNVHVFHLVFSTSHVRSLVLDTTRAGLEAS